jgi:hypothetical protein
MRIDLAALLFACVLAPVTVTAQAARAAGVASIDGIIRAYYESSRVPRASLRT